MEQQTPSKPVMDVTPPTPAGPAAHGNPSSVLANAAATGSDPSASPATVREPTRSSEALAAQPAESELVGGSKKAEAGTRTEVAEPANPQSLTVHAAPAMTDDDQPVPENMASAHEELKQPNKTPAPKSHASSVPKSHSPALAITGVILGMMVLSGLAILIYLNS